MGKTYAPYRIYFDTGIYSYEYYHTVSMGHWAVNPYLSVIGFAFVIEWSKTPWQMLGASGATLTLIIMYWIDSAFIKYRTARESRDIKLEKEARRHFKWIEVLSRLMTILFLVYCAIVGFHALLFLNSRSCWFFPSEKMQIWAISLYGMYTPNLTCTKSL